MIDMIQAPLSGDNREYDLGFGTARWAHGKLVE